MRLAQAAAIPRLCATLALAPFLLAGCALPPPPQTPEVRFTGVATAPVAVPAQPSDWQAEHPPVLPPLAWQQGRPAFMEDSTLAPLPERLSAADPAQLALDSLKLPAGFHIEIWASGLPGIRTLARADSGRIYAGSGAAGKVYEITDLGAQRSSRVLARRLDQPVVTYTQGHLFVLSANRLLRYDAPETQPLATPADLSTAFALPEPLAGRPHHLRAGPDGWLYVGVAAPCNICEAPDSTAQIRRYRPDGSGMEVLAYGVRSTRGLAWHPANGELWFTSLGRDWLGDDTPEDGVYHLARQGQDFGFPYCHLGRIPDPDLRRDRPCAGVATPVVSAGPHAAALGALFYTGHMFPADYRNALLIARNGSWNRHTKVGYDLVVVQADADGRHARLSSFIRGFADPLTNTYWGRPVDLLQMPDGALLVSDEEAGAIYRISYTGSTAAKREKPDRPRHRKH